MFLETEKYVAISDKNKRTYSMQYNILLQAICAEIDIVIKKLCFEHDDKTNAENMTDYLSVITKHDPNIKNSVVSLAIYDMKILPWKNIGFTRINGLERIIVPYWWDGYLKLKHNRLIFILNGEEFKILERNIQQANQKMY